MTESTTDALLSEITRFVRDVSPATVARVASVVREAADGATARSSLAGVGSRAGSHAAMHLLETWSRCPGLSGAELAMALEAAEVATRESEKSQSLELVWTGPESQRIASRRTDQVLYGLAGEARSDLLIVSFVAYGVDRLAELIRAAADRDVAIDLILETRTESGGQIDFDGLRALEPLPRSTRVYCWPLEERRLDDRGRRGVLHAKTMVVDRSSAFVTSANLTGRALERNMELGVVVRGGPIPERIARHFEDLIDRGVLVPVDVS